MPAGGDEKAGEPDGHEESGAAVEPAVAKEVRQVRVNEPAGKGERETHEDETG